VPLAYVPVWFLKSMSVGCPITRLDSTKRDVIPDVIPKGNAKPRRKVWENLNKHSETQL
jgi:hypothetical protein